MTIYVHPSRSGILMIARIIFSLFIHFALLVVQLDQRQSEKDLLSSHRRSSLRLFPWHSLYAWDGHQLLGLLVARVWLGIRTERCERCPSVLCIYKLEHPSTSLHLLHSDTPLKTLVTKIEARRPEVKGIDTFDCLARVSPDECFSSAHHFFEDSYSHHGHNGFFPFFFGGVSCNWEPDVEYNSRAPKHTVTKTE
jgi:hypothetical protein